MTIQLFCQNPTCRTYLGATVTTCPVCEQERPISSLPPEPNIPLWQAKVNGPVRGRAVIVPNLVLFAWGDRRGAGGVTAIDYKTGEQRWVFQTDLSVEGGLTVAGDRVLFGTLAFLGSGATLNCLDLQTGGQVWSQPLTGSAWSAPVVEEVRVYVGCDSGQVHCFDIREGNELSGWPISLDKGRVWLTYAENKLAVLSATGQVHVLEAMRGRQHRAPWNIDVEVTSAPLLIGEQLYFGAREGNVIALTLSDGESHTLVEELKKVVAAPAYADGILFVGAQDHCLSAIDIETGRRIWKAECGRSISSSPVAAEGIVYVGANDGMVYAYDAQRGEQLWYFAVEADAPVMGSATYHEGVIYIGAEDGGVYALPWHLGQYARAAELLVMQKRFAEAARFYALAGDLELCDTSSRQQCEQAALENWRKAGEWEEAARFHESILVEDPAQIAIEFEKAGQALYRSNAWRAAVLLRRAADWYEEIEDEEGLERCSRLAALVAQSPQLGLREVNIPKEWEEGEQQLIVIELINRGNADAENIRVRLAGNLAVRVWVEFAHLLAGQPVEVEATLIARSSGDLVAEVKYEDQNHDKWSRLKRFPIHVKPSSTMLDIGGDVGALILDDLKSKVKVSGDAGLVKVLTSRPETEKTTETTFSWPDPPSGWEIDDRTLVEVRLAEERFTVPAGHWAIFLADEAAIATVAPGRYERKKFPPLKARRISRDRPAWKAVLFNGSLFRMVFRLGPFRTQEGVSVGVECGLTTKLDESKPYRLWKGVLGAGDQLITSALVKWLEPEISGAISKWIRVQSEVSLSPGFSRREEVLLELEEALRQTARQFGMEVQDPLWALNFIIPGRERIEALRERAYWDEAERKAKGGAGNETGFEENTCPGCHYSNEMDAEHCTQCGQSLKG